MNRASVLAIMASASVIAGSICLNAGRLPGEDFAIALFMVAGGLGLWAIRESYCQK